MNKTAQQTKAAPWPEINMDDNTFHPIDFQDVSISEYAISIVLKAAGMLITQQMPAGPDQISTQQAVAMFIDRLFWEENDGGLIMCADIDSKSFCLAIPKEHWSLAGRGPLN